LGFNSTNYVPAAISDAVSVGTLTGCVVTATSGINWITVTSTTSNTPASSTVAYTVSATNAFNAQWHDQHQRPGSHDHPRSCGLQLHLGFNGTNYGPGAISDVVNVGTLTGCVVTATSGTNWITVTSTTSNAPNSSTVAYSVSANPTHLTRTGTINISGQVLAITQDAAPCIYTLGFTSTNYDSAAISATVSVGTLTGCVVTATSGINWITVTSTTSNTPNSSTVAYAVSANPRI